MLAEGQVAVAVLKAVPAEFARMLCDARRNAARAAERAAFRRLAVVASNAEPPAAGRLVFDVRVAPGAVELLPFRDQRAKGVDLGRVFPTRAQRLAPPGERTVKPFLKRLPSERQVRAGERGRL